MKAKFYALIRVPIFAESEEDARTKIAPYVSNMQVEAEVAIKRSRAQRRAKQP